MMNKGQWIVENNGTHSIQLRAKMSSIAYRARDCLHPVSRKSLFAGVEWARAPLKRGVGGPRTPE